MAAAAELLGVGKVSSLAPCPPPQVLYSTWCLSSRMENPGPQGRRNWAILCVAVRCWDWPSLDCLTVLWQRKLGIPPSPGGLRGPLGPTSQSSLPALCEGVTGKASHLLTVASIHFLSPAAFLQHGEACTTHSRDSQAGRLPRPHPSPLAQTARGFLGPESTQKQKFPLTLTPVLQSLR